MKKTPTARWKAYNNGDPIDKDGSTTVKNT